MNHPHHKSMMNNIRNLPIFMQIVKCFYKLYAPSYRGKHHRHSHAGLRSRKHISCFKRNLLCGSIACSNDQKGNLQFFKSRLLNFAEEVLDESLCFHKPSARQPRGKSRDPFQQVTFLRHNIPPGLVFQDSISGNTGFCLERKAVIP